MNKSYTFSQNSLLRDNSHENTRKSLLSDINSPINEARVLGVDQKENIELNDNLNTMTLGMNR